MTARFKILLGLFAIVAFVLGLVLARLALAPRGSPIPPTENATILPTPRELPALDLVDQDGQALGPGFFRDRWTLVFFGFTHCPDVCPTTLTVMAQAGKQLADLPEDKRPRVLLITVDPERDTPPRLKEYVRFFDASFGAATGTLAGVEQAAGAFAVPFAKVPLPGGGYTMDHGAGVYLVAPSGSIIAYSSPPLQPDVIARDYRTAVQYFEETH
jgi:protein SCO1/2